MVPTEGWASPLEIESKAHSPQPATHVRTSLVLAFYRVCLSPHFHGDERKRVALGIEISDILQISECPVLQIHSLNLYHLTTWRWFKKELTF